MLGIGLGLGLGLGCANPNLINPNPNPNPDQVASRKLQEGRDEGDPLDQAMEKAWKEMEKVRPCQG